VAIEDRLKASLDAAWDELNSGTSVPFHAPRVVIDASANLIELDSAPDRGMILAIAAGTAEDPGSDPGALQDSAGVDRRGQAKALMVTLTHFREEHGLTIKISQEPGVSNPWREPVIDDDWLSRRTRLPSAKSFMLIVRWLRSAPSEQERSERAQGLLNHLAYLIVQLAVGNSLSWPRFRVSPRLAMALVANFLHSTPNRPDATEAVVCAAARAIATALPGNVAVERRDTNSPDPIDVLLIGATGTTGIEVTDDAIKLSKLQHEVVPAMLELGLSHAVVVSRPPETSDIENIQEYLSTIYKQFEQRIDLLTVEDIGIWLSMPGLPTNVASNFIWEIGPELDRFSAIETRRAWHAILNQYIDSATGDQGSA